MSQGSNSPSFDCQDTGPRPTSQDPIKDTKDSEIGDPDVQEFVNDNTESNVEHGYSSGGGALVDILDAPPENNSQFEISEAFVNVIAEFVEDNDDEIHELAKKSEAGFGMDIFKFWDNLKRTMESEFKRNFRAASPQLSLATPGELANLNIEMEKVLQEMLETFHKMNWSVKKYRELFFYSSLGPDNSESNVEHEDSSGCGAFVDIVDAPPAKKIKFEISEALVNIISLFLDDEEIYDLAQKSDAGFGMDIIKFRDTLKQTMEFEFKIDRSASSQTSLATSSQTSLATSSQTSLATSSQTSLATPGGLANRNIEMERALQEILESFHKMNGLVSKYRELFSSRLPGDFAEAEKARIKKERERREKEDGMIQEYIIREYEILKGELDNNRYWLPTFFDNYLPWFAKPLPFLFIPPMIFIGCQILEHPIANGFICDIVSWLNSFRQ